MSLHSQTVGNYEEGEIILPSKMNGLTIGEVEMLWPTRENIPLYPIGFIERRDLGRFEVVRRLNNDKSYVISTSDFLIALNALIEFCEKHKIKV